MKYKINALQIYEVGQRKDHNGNPHQEDCLYPAIGQVDNATDRLFILCDGMGGHAQGEVASEAVCEAMSKTISQAMQAGEKFSDTLLQRAITAAYDLLDERDTSTGDKKMGTTMTFLMLHEEGYTIAHIGDSRVYHIRPNNGTHEDVVHVTRDHSLVNDLLRIGQITPEEAKDFPQKNVITRAMQPHLERRCRADIFHGQDVRPGDYFYMCSDGMLEQMSDDNLCFNLAEQMSDGEKKERLIRLTCDNRDNHSAHLIHILDVEGVKIVNKPEPVAEVPKGSKIVPPAPSKPNNKRSRLAFWVVSLLIALAFGIGIGFLVKSLFTQKEEPQKKEKTELPQKDIQKPDPEKANPNVPVKDQPGLEEQKQDVQQSDLLLPEKEGALIDHEGENGEEISLESHQTDIEAALDATEGLKKIVKGKLEMSSEQEGKSKETNPSKEESKGKASSQIK